MNKITLTRTKQGWMAHYSGPHANQMIDIFGADTLPTAFTAQAAPAHVLVEISALNPGTIVEVR